MELGFEFPREHETLFHETVLRQRRETQRVKFRPGVAPNGVAADLVTGPMRSRKQLARAVRLLQDEFALEPAMLKEALAYTNNTEDALQFLSLQYTSQELPALLRAQPLRNEQAIGTSGEEDGVLLATVHERATKIEDDQLKQEDVVKHTEDEEVADSWDALAGEEEEPVEPAKTVEREASEETKSALSWTQQYVQMMAQRELEEARQQEEAELAAKQLEQATTADKELMRMENELTHLLTVSREAKEQKSMKKKAQKALADEIQKLKARLTKRGWSEAEYFARQRSAKEPRSSKKEPVIEQVVSIPSAEAADEAKIGIDDEDDLPLGLGMDEEEDDAVEVQANEAEEDDDAGGLFGLLEEAESTIVSADAIQKSAPVEEELVMPSEPVSTGKGKRGKGKKAAARATPAATWTGKTPRDHLQDHCQKNKWPRPNYKRVSLANSRRYLYSLVLDRKTHKEEFSVSEPSDLAHGFDSIDEAKDMVATHALYALMPDLPLYRVLPPLYRGVWTDWVKQKEVEAAASVNAEAQEFNALIDDIYSQLPSEISQKKAAVLLEETVTTAVKPSAERNEKEMPPTANLLEDWDVDDWDADLSDSEDAAKSADDVGGAEAALQSHDEPESEETKAYSQKLKHQFQKNLRSNEQYRKRKMQLPISSFKSHVLEALDAHNVILISGETGCGKSTQVPQFLLEDALVNKERGAMSQIVCTQPRRLAAISLAERVSQELGETALASPDSLCGYQIRLENRMSRNTRLSFCTTGILLRRLQERNTLEHEISHIIVDEVHERDLQNDVLLSILRQFLKGSNAARKHPLKVILMSATLNAASFQQYFGGEDVCPMLTVPGRTFPVEEFFLEDVLEATQYIVDESSPSYRPIETTQQSTVVKISGRGGTSFNQKVSWTSESGKSRASQAGTTEEKEQYSERTLKSLDVIDPFVINYELIQELIEHLVSESAMLREAVEQSSASILVFLPGMQEISTLLDMLAGHRVFRDERKFDLIPLHSSLSPQDQQRIFRMPKGVIRIIATTNIAETSLTIEDAKIVIDSGKMKEMRHDSTRRTNVLEEVWISRANAKQRMGRAGRTSGGMCYRLFPRSIYRSTMDEQPIAEIKRAPLASLCLQIKTFGVSTSCQEFLGGCLDPPNESNVLDALGELYEVGALNQEDETLTPLGGLLAQLPTDIKVGKMLLMGAIFQVFDAISTCAAILETKSPFVAPFGCNAEMQAARKKFFVGQSDLLTDVNAYEKWRQQFLVTKNNRAEKTFCQQFFLSRRGLMEITKLKQQFQNIVTQLGFLPKRQSSASPPPEMMTHENVATIAAIVYAGLAPNLVHIEQTQQEAKRGLLLRERDHGLVRVHPGSINYKTAQFPSAFLTYAIKLHTSQIYLPTSHLVMPSGVCLFSHKLEMLPQTRKQSASGATIALRVNDWILFQSSFRSAIMLQEIREELHEFISASMQSPPFAKSKSSQTLPELSAETDRALIQALRSLFKTEYDARDAKQLLTKQLSLYQRNNSQ